MRAVVAAATLVAAGCGSFGDGLGRTAPDASDATGSIHATLVAAPPGVLCLQLAIVGSTRTTAKFPLTPGQPADVDVGSLAAGSVSILPSAYAIACDSVDGASVATWDGPAVAATIQVGASTKVKLVLRPAAGANGTVTFVGAALAIAAGDGVTYAVLQDGTVLGWGNLPGIGVSSSASTVLSGPGGITRIAASPTGRHACALTTDGAAYCWGDNAHGQLGNGLVASMPRSGTMVAASMPGGVTFKQITVGDSHTCAVASDNGAYCWGSNAAAQLGNPGGEGPGGVESWIPRKATSLGAVAEASAGHDFTCFRTVAAHVTCIGDDKSGQFGDGDTAPVLGASPTISPYFPVVALGAGGTSCYPGSDGALVCPSFTCALGPAGTVQCAGSGTNGTLGNGSAADSRVPMLVYGMPNATALAVGGDHACAILNTGNVWCWGSGLEGQLGNGLAPLQQSLASQVTALTGATAISSGLHHTCALRNDGTMWCWGDNAYGELGDGTIENRFVPVQVAF